jgi:PBP1b-binding outer membrane lipoprotein LpoB
MEQKKNYLVILFVCLFVTACNTSQKEQTKDELEKSQEASLTLTFPRYQIVQSTIAARGTYKVDTYEGKVYQLVLLYWQTLYIYCQYYS